MRFQALDAGFLVIGDGANGSGDEWSLVRTHASKQVSSKPLSLARVFDAIRSYFTKRFTPSALHVLAYNMTRVMNIMGIQPLMAAIQA